ncbi:MAG: hypothetical protein FWG88_10740 [Oscillospiraceae bacterium]|nr:hypothetical protein [Oscillospiraceae bacterium]
MRIKDKYEIPDFDYTSEGFTALEKALKDGKIVKNPFAKFYNKNNEISIVQDTIEEQNNT